MIYTFTPINILDTVRPEKQLTFNNMTPKEYDFLLQAINKRENFKYIVANFLQNLQTVSIIQVKPLLDDYLSTNVELLKILSKKSSFPLNFQYQTFLVPGSSITLSAGNEETLTVEIIMVRYCCAFLFYYDAEKNVRDIEEILPKTLEYMEEDFVKQLKDKFQLILEKYFEGWLYLYKVVSHLPHLQPSFSKDTANIVEIKPEMIQAVKELLEVNANNIFLENLRIRKEYEKMSQVCRTNYDKLQRITQVLKFYQTKISKELLLFSEFAILFYKTCGLYSYLMNIEADVKLHEFTKKNFFQCSRELFNGAKLLLTLTEGLNSFDDVKSYDIFKYAYFYCNKLFQPTATRWINIYEEVQIKNKLAPEDAEAYFNSIIGNLDYLHALYEKKVMQI